MKLLFVFCLVLTLGGYAKAFMIFGDSVSIGQGEGRAFVDIDHDGKLNAVGISLTESAMNGLPAHDMTSYILKLPSVLRVLPYDHMMVDWNPHGHDPNPIYSAPHFDFHFYLMSEAERKAISCLGDDAEVCTRMPGPDLLPPFYVPTPAGVPEMGWHWVDSRSPEFNGKPFTSTFIYGYYDGKLSFIEPMITREFFLAKSYFEQDIPVPQVFSKTGYYPRSYSVHFNRKKKIYLISLEKLEMSK